MKAVLFKKKKERKKERKGRGGEGIPSGLHTCMWDSRMSTLTCGALGEGQIKEGSQSALVTMTANRRPHDHLGKKPQFPLPR